MSAAPSEFNTLLDAIRARPGMYLGKPSLLRLWLFLEGYQAALWAHQIVYEKLEIWDLKFLLHVSRRTDGKPVGARGYHTMILPHVGGDEAEALALFWQLLDEFRALTMN